MRYWQQVILVVLGAALAPQAVSGDIYKCIDAGGRKVFSQKPCPDSTVHGTELQHTLWRQMRAMVAEGKTLGAHVRGDVESIRQCQQASGQFLARVGELKEPVASVRARYPELQEAFDLLQECANCRFGAIAYCEKADLSLNRAMNRLY